MSETTPFREGQTITGPLFSEPMLIETVRPNGTGTWALGLVGQHTHQFRRVALTADGSPLARIAETGCTCARNKVERYWVDIDALTQPMRVREDRAPYGTQG